VLSYPSARSQANSIRLISIRLLAVNPNQSKKQRKNELLLRGDDGWKRLALATAALLLHSAHNKRRGPFRSIVVVLGAELIAPAHLSVIRGQMRAIANCAFTTPFFGLCSKRCSKD
jgi:hypothetical protein